jgi:HAD superfamily hydrolase (TIGR01509 family)
MTKAGVEIGHSVSPDYLHSLIGLLGQELQNRLVRDFGQEFPVAEFLQSTGQYLDLLLGKGAPLKPGAIELIQYLSSRGTPMAVATSLKKKEAEHQLKTANLHQFFSVIVGRDEVPNSKPHPDLYLKATSLLNLEPQTCVALEDSYNGIKSAHSAGCMVIMVPDVLAPTEEVRKLCTGIEKSLSQVKAVFQANT